MSNQDQSAVYHSNRYHAESACEHCEGIIRHETWCITQDANVLYAYQIVLDSDKMTLQDTLILHSLGVSWAGNACKGACVAAG